MAGNYNHCVDRETIKLYEPQYLLGTLDTHSSDVYQAIEEM